ncbi:MAG: hypothetical protein ACTSUS_03630 [Candidatus Freyarchaeota archaeon]
MIGLIIALTLMLIVGFIGWIMAQTFKLSMDCWLGMGKCPVQNLYPVSP